MTYRFVASFHDLGRRRGPILGLTVHMAEGGGTVGFLSRKNTHGVSVHWVIEYDGDIVQMLREDHMHTSIRIRNLDGSSALRTTDDKDKVFGATAAKAVLGDWAYVKTGSLGPNHATVAVELEGFAAKGPNPAQTKALGRLITDLRTRYPRIGLLGHRDHNIKACPGKLIPWADYGGHGAPQTSQGEPMAIYTRTDRSGVFVAPTGQAVRGFRETPTGWEVVKTRPAGDPSSYRFDYQLGRISGDMKPSSLLHGASGMFEGLYVTTAEVEVHVDEQAPDCTEAVAAEQLRVQGIRDSAVDTLGGI